MNANTAFLILAVALLFASINAPGAATSTHDRWDDSLTLLIRDSRTMHLPVEPLENKIREGRAKNRSAAEIYPVVKNRQKLLLRIRDNHRGVVPQDHVKQLFDFERESLNPTASRPAPTEPPVKTLPRPSARPQVTESVASEASERPEATSVGKPTDASDTHVQGNDKTKQIEKRIEKTDAKAAKTLEKAASRAEQRMRAIEKQVQKRAMKRQGGGK